MSLTSDALLADPFGELEPLPYRKHLQLLGARVVLESDSRALMRIAAEAFANLPKQRLTRREPAPTVRLAMRLSNARVTASSSPTPSLSLSSGAGLLAGALGDLGRALLAPDLGAGLVVVAPELLKDPYSLRYELLEFAVYTLAARAGGLAPLHAACVGTRGRGALILGDSGAGKSTLAAQCLLDGLSFVAEDSVFLEPATLRATGLASFLHLRPESPALLTSGTRSFPIARARRITRRSGVMKLEIDLRRGGFRLAARPLAIGALIFVSPTRAADQSLLIPMGRAAARARLQTTQPYAAAQAAWPAALRRMATVPAYELRRGSTPQAGSAALRRLLLCTSR